MVKYNTNNYKLFGGNFNLIYIMKSIKSIPFVLFISGVPCVGKTTISYKLLEEFPFFKRITELDIIKTCIRSLIKENNLQDKNENYKCLFESTTESDFATFKEQAKVLYNHIKCIVVRQKKRCIPTIIEGINIVPSIYFDNYIPKEGFKKNVLFINFYISDENEHFRRRLERCQDRNYSLQESIIKEKIINYTEKNKMLHEETLELSKKVDNVFSLDISELDISQVVEIIKNITTNYINKHLIII